MKERLNETALESISKIGKCIKKEGYGSFLELIDKLINHSQETVFEKLSCISEFFTVGNVFETESFEDRSKGIIPAVITLKGKYKCNGVDIKVKIKSKETESLYLCCTLTGTNLCTASICA